MDPTTLTALKNSITHWQRMKENRKKAKQEVEVPGASNCALCNLFLRHNCKNCPVFESTGQLHCSGTPYEDSMKIFLNGTEAEWKAKAQEEINFLTSLLPQ